MADPNLFEELKSVLQEFKDFLDENVPVIKPAIQALGSIFSQINDLIDSLVSLLNDLKTEIDNLDVASIPGLDKVSEFTGGITSLLETAKNLLPDQSDAIDDVLRIANIASSLPTLDEIKTEIKSLLDAIIAHLNSLKA